jgi:ATP-dependent helicase/nuclease subunit B
MVEKARPGTLFTIDPGINFLQTLVSELCEGRLVEGFSCHRDDLLPLADVTIYLPTRRAARALRSEFVDYFGGVSAILPRIRPLGETEDDGDFLEHIAADALDELPPIGRVDALLELASLVERWKSALPAAISGFHQGSPLIAPASPADAVWLARGLLDLIETMERESIAWDRLDQLDVQDYAEWWQLTLAFLKIARDFWPARLAERARSSPTRQRTDRLLSEAQRLTRRPPDGPVIVAGSTGSIPATATLIRAVAASPRGAVVFPGLDMGIADAVWPLVGMAEIGGVPDPSTLGHPQYGLSVLLQKLGASRGDVRSLGRADPLVAARTAIVSKALLPAQATDSWSQVPSDLEEINAAFADVTLIEAATEREEALAVATAMRLAGEKPDAIVALVTPDRNLARRVATELHRFGIAANDSGGTPLADSPQGSLLRLLLDAVMQPGDPVALTGLLNHPLARFGLTQDEMQRAAHVFEMIALRGSIGDVDIAALGLLLEERLDADRAASHRPAWRRRLTEADHDLARRMAENIERIVAPLAGRFVRFAPSGDDRPLDTRFPVAQWAQDTIAVLEAAVSDPHTGLDGLWGDEPGEALARLFNGVLESEALLTADGAQWADIVAALLAGETVKPMAVAHPRIFIWGTLEARLQHVDTLVLAGLNEGIWPGQARNDPFLSRPMKMALGLEPPERRTGLAAHDFQMAMGAGRVVLSRVLRAGHAPTIASRWLQRLLVVAGEGAGETMRQAGQRIISAAAALDERPAIAGATRPEPRPPADRQPKRYSFSEVRLLRRDPYAIYARRVLRLDPLDELIRDPGVAERGTLFHAVLERFTRAGHDAVTEDAPEILWSLAEDCLAESRLPEHIAVLWRPRLAQIARGFIAWERARSEDVVRRFTELRGEMPIGVADVVVSGMADRIDILADGTAEIIDYKSGLTPTRNQARALLDPQLPLEAAVLMHGGFAHLGRVVPRSLQYVRLRPGDMLRADRLEGGDRPFAKPDDATWRTATDLGQEAISKLAGFVAVLAEGRRGFASRLIPASAREFGGEYDHLARVAEWSSIEGDDVGEGAEGTVS